MTEKLYYKDAFIKKFNALVVSCTEVECGYETVFDKTAFFPEEGGQSADKGEIDGITVKDVKLSEGIIYH